MTPGAGAVVIKREEDFLDQFYFQLGRLQSPFQCLMIATIIAAMTSLVAVVSTYLAMQDTSIGILGPVLVFAYLLPFLLIQICSFVLMRGFSVLHQRNLNLRQAVERDELTRLANRSAFYRQGKDMFLDARMAEQPLSLIMQDVDFFKSINDTYGHLAGDHALQHLSEIFSRCTRDDDFVARWGGEEFVILLKNADQNGAMRFAERVRKAVSESPFIWNGEQVFVTLSAGVTQMTAEDDGFDALLARADKALYIAKSAGRNQVHPLWVSSDQSGQMLGADKPHVVAQG